MSGYELNHIVKERLRQRKKNKPKTIIVDLTDPETVQLDEMLGCPVDCPKAIERAKTVDIEELYRLYLILLENRKKKKTGLMVAYQ